jgi:hypothetical protein
VATDGDDADGDADIDLRIAVSRFTRQYSSALSIVALVGLANGVALDVRPANCRFIVRSNVPFLLLLDVAPESVASCVERPTSLPAGGDVVQTVGELRERVWRSLYADHLGPLFERVLEVTKVAPSLVWTNAAEWVAMVSDAADEYLDTRHAQPYVDDRRAILAAQALPGLPGPNPLGGLVSWDPVDDPAFPNGVAVRKICCVTYMLQDRLGRLCQNCGFLPLDERLALIHERHNVAMGTPGGPAERASIERGLAKLGRHA